MEALSYYLQRSVALANAWHSFFIEEVTVSRELTGPIQTRDTPLPLRSISYRGVSLLFQTRDIPLP